MLVTQTGASYALDSNGTVIATTTSPIAEPRVVRALYPTATNALGGSTWLDGVQEATGDQASTNVTTLFELGGRTAGAAQALTSGFSTARSPEVAVYKSALTAANANRSNRTWRSSTASRCGRRQPLRTTSIPATW